MLNLPNALSILRIVLIPAFLTAMVYRRYDLALYIFLAAAVSDKLDGLIARARRQQTELGAFLDPLADKFMLMSSFVAFWAFGLIPPWLAILVLSRDIIITTGWLTLRLLGHIRRAEPSMVGKLAVASQFALLVAVLLNINYGLLEALEAPLQWAVAALTGASGLQYINRGLKASHEEGRDNRRGP